MKINNKGGYANLCSRNIKMYRKQQGVSQSELAVRLQLQNVTLEQKAISRIERGERIVTDFELLAVSKVFNVSIYDLISE